MHWSGKVLAGLVVVATLLATYLTAKVIVVRNSWTRKTTTFQRDYADNTARLNEAKQQIRQLRGDLEETLREWGSSFPAVDTRLVNAAQGQVSADIGTNQGLKQGQVIHGFELKEDGSSIYRGAFAIVGAQTDAVNLQSIPGWRVRPDEAAAWRPGKWRWRTAIPQGYIARFLEQQTAFLKTDETFFDRSNALAAQQTLQTTIADQRARRQAEIVGGEQLLQEEALPAEFRTGLLAAMASTEEDRNKVLVENADLRRQVRAARDAILRLQAENEQLVAQLPQPGALVSAKPAE
jgi:hypothetical protein